MKHPRRIVFYWSWFICVVLTAAWPAHATVTALSYWRMGEVDAGAANGHATTNTIDSIGGNNLSFNASVIYTSSVAPAALSSTTSTLALQFTGQVYGAAAVIPDLTNDFGIECWVKPTQVTTGQVVLYNGDTGTSGWGIYEKSGNYLGLFGGISFIDSAPAIAGTWTHLALVRAGGTNTFYVNGVAAAGINTSAPHPPAGLFLAGENNLHGEVFSGALDEVRVFNFVSGQFRTNDLLYYNAQPVFTLGTNVVYESASAGTDTVKLVTAPANASWSAMANVSWLHLTNSSGTGSGTVGFTFDDNPGAARSGTLTIAGQTLTVNQAVPSYSLGGNYDFYWTGDLLEEPAMGGTDVVSIIVTPNAGQWSISPSDGWIHPSVTAGAGTTNVSVTFDANTDPAGGVRFGTIYINNPATPFLRVIVFQQAPPTGTGQATYRFTGNLQPFLPEYVPAGASSALKSVQSNDVFYLSMTLVPSTVNDYYGVWPCAANNITFSVPSRGLLYSIPFADLTVTQDANNPNEVRWDVGVDSTVHMTFWARDFNQTALANGNVPNPLNLTGFHANGFAQIILYDGEGGNPELYYGNLAPLPNLNLQHQPDTNTLFWLNTDLTYTQTLQTATSLLPKTVWQTVTNAPVILNLSNFVALPSTNAGAHFFRLKEF